jgi:hypothetical protein
MLLKNQPKYLKKEPFLPPHSTYIDGPTVKEKLSGTNKKLN